MKKIVCVLSMVLLFSCSSSDNKLVGRAEDYLKTNLKDPKSYERIDFLMYDTVMLKQKLQNEYAIDTAAFNGSKTPNSIVSEYRAHDSIDAAIVKSKLDNLKTDSIYSITIKLNYRAKNGMGGLDIFQNDIVYYPLTNEFQTASKEKE